jgi:hypothetical protein
MRECVLRSRGKARVSGRFKKPTTKAVQKSRLHQSTTQVACIFTCFTCQHGISLHAKEGRNRGRPNSWCASRSRGVCRAILTPVPKVVRSASRQWSYNSGAKQQHLLRPPIHSLTSLHFLPVFPFEFSKLFILYGGCVRD